MQGGRETFGAVAQTSVTEVAAAIADRGLPSPGGRGGGRGLSVLKDFDTLPYPLPSKGGGPPSCLADSHSNPSLGNSPFLWRGQVEEQTGIEGKDSVSVIVETHRIEIKLHAPAENGA